MDENVQTNATVGETQDNATASVEKKQETESRTFTQQELDEIVQKRVIKERERFSDYEALKEKANQSDEKDVKITELQKKVDEFTQKESVRTIRESVSKSTGVPAELLNGATEEECTAQAQAILAFKKQTAYPSLEDGGEIQHTSTGSTAEQFANWFNETLKK